MNKYISIANPIFHRYNKNILFVRDDRMGVLTNEQLQSGYFKDIGGFPPAKRICTVAEYDGSEECCIACTQLHGRYSDSECRKILKDGIHFLNTNPSAFRALHFNSHVY